MINKDLKVAVLGAGAMGCLFGGLLAEKGLDVILIDVWKEHVDAINNNGLKMDGHGGDRFIKVKATTDTSSLEKVDAIIVMCKATALTPALNSIKNIVGEKTVLMSFQNGIGHEAIMQEPSTEYNEGIITEELRPGYLVSDDRVLRHSLVKVSSGKIDGDDIPSSDATSENSSSEPN